MNKPTISIEELFSEDIKDPKFLDLYRRQKPYSELIVDVVNRRNELKLTQKELAKKAGTYQSRISKIESGEHDFRLSTIINIATALETEVEIRLKPLESLEEHLIYQIEPREVVLNIVRSSGFVVPGQEETLGTDAFSAEEVFGTLFAGKSEPVCEVV